MRRRRALVRIAAVAGVAGGVDVKSVRHRSDDSRRAADN
jgi:hypothetical protein